MSGCCCFEVVFSSEPMHNSSFFVGLCAAGRLEYFAEYLFSSVAWYLFCHFAHGTEATGGATYSSPLLTKSQNKYKNRRTPMEWELITQTDNTVRWEPYKNM
jgi:hypothetical protein